MRLFAYIAPAVLLFVAVAAAGIIRTDSFQASSDGSNIVLRWITDDETNVAHFDVERRTGTDGDFVAIATVDAKGPSLYEYTDYSAFHKVTTIYQYRVKVVFADKTPSLYVGPVTVAHSVSGVRRTWGSIKAMFR